MEKTKDTIWKLDTEAEDVWKDYGQCIYCEKIRLLQAGFDIDVHICVRCGDEVANADEFFMCGADRG